MPAKLDGTAWLASWDRQQELYMPDREERYAAMMTVVGGVAGPRPRVLDLACGPGSISHRVLSEFPEAEIVAVDIDPALLSIAADTLGDPAWQDSPARAGQRSPTHAGQSSPAGVGQGSPAHAGQGSPARVRLARLDIADPAWTDGVAGPFDAVLTATALHWLPEPTLRRVYGDVRSLLRPGGVFCNAEHMPPATTGRLGEAVRGYRGERREQALASGSLDWAAWWREAAADPALTELVAERNAIFMPRKGEHDSPDEAAHSAEFVPPAAWHVETLKEAGFSEVDIVWRGFDDAVVAALA